MSNFKQNGIHIMKSVLGKKNLDLFYNSLLNISYLHLKKIKEKKTYIEKIYNSNLYIGDKLSKIFELYEEKDKEALYQLQMLYPSNYELRNILNTPKILNEFKITLCYEKK